MAAVLACLLGVTTFLGGSWQARAQTVPSARDDQSSVQPGVSATFAGRTPRQVLDGSAVLVSHYNPEQKLRLALAVQPPHMAEEEQFLKELQTKGSPNFHRFLTADEWNARFAPSAEDEQAVADWAISQGLTVTNRFANRLLVDVEAPAGVIEKAFGITINSYQLGDEVDFANDRDPVIPAHLSGIVSGVLGLDSIQRLHRVGTRSSKKKGLDYVPGAVYAESRSSKGDGDPSRAPWNQASPVALDSSFPTPQMMGSLMEPANIQSSQAYNYAALYAQSHCCNPHNDSTGSPPDSSIAIASFGGFNGSDVNAFFQYYGLAWHYTTYAIDGTNSPGTECTGGTTGCTLNADDGEGPLDLEYATAMANSYSSSNLTAHVYVYEGVNNLCSTFADVYNFMLSDGHARVHSTSYGGSESGTFTPCGTNILHGILNNMTGEGWTLVAAAGDDGSTDICDSSNMTATVSVDYPGSDPNVVSVGGTRLDLDTSGKYVSEITWNSYPSTTGCWGAGGGGVSSYFDQSATGAYWQSGLGGTMRMVPDIALNAGAGQTLYDGGGWDSVYGTSIGAPELAGFFAQENSYLAYIGSKCGSDGKSACDKIGNANPILYYEAINKNAAHYPFYDITSGCNYSGVGLTLGLKDYCAGPGYDEATGWGSLNMLQLAWAFNWEIIPARGAPYVTFTGPATNAWYNTNQTVNWKINDYEPAGGTPGTGIAGLTQGWDSIPADPSSEATPGSGNSFYSGPQFPGSSAGCLSLAAGDCGSGSGQGCHTVYVRGWNNQGWSTALAAAHSGYPETYGPICYDTVDPTITVSNAPVANSDGWNNTSVKVTLNATDPGGSNASGIYNTYYQIDAFGCSPGALSSCTVYNGPFTISTQGEHFIWYFTLDKAGNYSANAGNIHDSVNIDETAPVTTAALSGTLNGSVYNSAVKVTLSATDNLSGVQYTYYSLDGGASTTYTAALNVTALGSHSVKFHSVDNAGNTETTKTVSFTISQASQTITFANPGTQTYGTPLTLTATASSGLTVSYASMTTAVCTVSGSVVSFASPGTCTIQATQAGSTYIAAATPVTQSFTVNKEAQTITWASPGPQTYGTPLTLSATASSGLPVSFAAAPATSSVCTVSGTTATFLTAGTCTIAATQAGNSDYAAAPTVGHTFYVNPEAQTITFTSLPARTYGAAPFTVSATASSGLTVAFASTTTSVCTVSVTTVTLVAAGTCTIKATQAGNAGYKAAPAVSQSFTVNKEAQTITWASPGPQTYGTPLTLSATASSGLPVSFAAAPSTSSVCTVSGTTATFLTTGTCTIAATQAGNSAYAAAPEVGHTFYVNPAAQTITFPNPGTQTVGAVVTLTATASSGLTVSYTSSTSSVCTITTSTTATMKAAGTCTIVAAQAGNADYRAAPAVSQSFKVTAAN
jgi:hypothetical protein